MNASDLLFKQISHKVDVKKSKLSKMLIRNGIFMDNISNIMDQLTKLNLSVSSHDYGSYFVFELLKENDVIDSFKTKRFEE